jgi:D-isomer specific 2-hydroxyacid dehydrogenase, catalytic domain
LLALAPGCVGWLVGVEPVTPHVVEAADKLMVISRNGSGVDNLPLDVWARKGVKVVIASGANALGVAELTISLVISALRSIPVVGLRNREIKELARRAVWRRETKSAVAANESAVPSAAAISFSLLNSHAYQPHNPGCGGSVLLKSAVFAPVSSGSGPSPFAASRRKPASSFKGLRPFGLGSNL